MGINKREAVKKEKMNRKKKTKISAYIDSDVFVSSVRQKEQYHKESKEFIDFVVKEKIASNIAFFTSRFTEVEIASAIFRQTRDKDRARATLHKLERPWKNKISLLPEKPSKKINLDDLIIKLVETTLKYGTRFGDTVHANNVESYAIDYLVTWNKKDFLKLEKKIKKLKVLNPTEMLKGIKNKKNGTRRDSRKFI